LDSSTAKEDTKQGPTKYSNIKNAAQKKKDEIQKMYKEHKDMQNMRPEDRAQMNKLLDDMYKEEAEKNPELYAKRQSKFKAMASKIKDQVAQKQL
jgi:protein-tyrosine-phosphatase